MPQIFCAVQCFECKTFQVQQEKKNPRFKCSICGTQQNMHRIYAKSSKAKDCREVVVNYNAARGEAIENEYELEEQLPDFAEQENEYYEVEHLTKDKWKEFAEDQEEEGFTIAAPTVVPKKPKPTSQKRALEHNSEVAPLNATKHARAAFPQQKEPTLLASAEKERIDIRILPPLSNSNQPLVNSNAQPLEAPAMMQGPVEKTALNIPEPPQQQIGKKWSSFIDNDDAW